MMKKWIALFLTVLITVSFCACGELPEVPTEEDVIVLITEYLEPQIEEYRQKLGVDDLGGDLEIKKYEIITETQKDNDGYISLNIRDRLVSPTLEKQLINGEVSEEMLQKISELEFEYDHLFVEGSGGVASGKPYVGMSASMIDNTSLGQHTKTGKNTVTYADEPPAKKHDCTLYYWMEGNRCVFIARVQDDIGKVIAVEANPSGSFFGN